MAETAGEVSGQGAREIDARGAVVATGFVDLHPHLDALVGWDPQLTPVSWRRRLGERDKAQTGAGEVAEIR